MCVLRHGSFQLDRRTVLSTHNWFNFKYKIYTVDQDGGQMIDTLSIINSVITREINVNKTTHGAVHMTCSITSEFSISDLAIQLQQYHMSFINYISLGNTNMNITRCKMHLQSPLPGCAKLSLLIIHICSAMEMYPAANYAHNFKIYSPKSGVLLREREMNKWPNGKGLGLIFQISFSHMGQQLQHACLKMDGG